MKPFADLKKMVKECLENDAGDLNDWEIEFLDSVFKQAKYSEKQAEIIERIWSKVYG